MKVEVVFLVSDNGPIFYGVFDSYLKIQDHFRKLGGREVRPIKGLGCFQVGNARYTVQTQTVNEPLV